ncbi:MAG: hypothetical protein SXA11_01405 [Cyanobacteriota bacterium]|nr:hypothetical protein [Cyanobacteriota bacterium]
MREDLQGLEITNREIRRLSGIGLERVFRPPTLGKFVSENFKSLAIASLLFIGYLLLAEILPQQNLLLFAIFLFFAIGTFIEDLYKIIVSARNKKLTKLFDATDKYNTIVKALAIQDEIEGVGSSNLKSKNRERVIEALELIREDLVRALTIERILRKHKRFISANTKLFASHLNDVTELLINDEANEHGRLLNEALEIAVTVRDEMKRLQDKHSRI